MKTPDLGVKAGEVIAEKYRLVELLGTGGMGSVWRCDHLSLLSPIALKVIKPSVVSNRNSVARFMREAKAAAMLRSPHVVQILDHGQVDKIAYIAMELLEGESLFERLRRETTLSWQLTRTVITHVGRAMQRAHETGIIHRDLKPDNVFLVQNDDEIIAKVLDFGIAKSAVLSLDLTGESPQTQTGALLGTPYYMSPEQATAQKDIDHRADLWAVGVITYECLVGERPYTGNNLGDLLMSICAKPQPIPSHKATVPAGFDDWFQRSQARDPDERWQSAREMTGALRELLDRAGPEPVPGAQVSHPTKAGHAMPAVTVQTPADEEIAEDIAGPIGAPGKPSSPTTERNGGIGPAATGPIAATIEDLSLREAPRLPSAFPTGPSMDSPPPQETLDPLSATQVPKRRRGVMVGALGVAALAVAGVAIAATQLGGDDAKSEGSKVDAAETASAETPAKAPEETTVEQPTPAASLAAPTPNDNPAPTGEGGSADEGEPTPSATAPSEAARRPVPLKPRTAPKAPPKPTAAPKVTPRPKPTANPVDPLGI